MCLAIALLFSTTALADDALLRRDIADIRAGRNPASTAVLGWTRDGVAFSRTSNCITIPGNGAGCAIVLTKHEGTQHLERDHMTLFNNSVYCALREPGCGTTMLDDKAVLTLIDDENEAREGLELLRGHDAADPTHALGADITLEVVLGNLHQPDQPSNENPVSGTVATVFARRGKRRIEIGFEAHVAENFDAKERAKITRAVLSPTKTHVLVVVQYHHIDVLMFDIKEIRDQFR